MNCPVCQCEKLHEGRVSCHNCGAKYPESQTTNPTKKEPRRKHKFLLEIVILITAMAVTFVVTFKSLKSGSFEGEKKPTEPKQSQNVDGDRYGDRISPYALSTYTIEKGYPKIVKKFGPRLGEIETFRKKAAEMAIDSGKCDFVEMSDLSDKSDLQHLIFWVDCKNGQRVFLDENQIKNQSQVLTESDKSWSKANAIRACQTGIKERALIPDALEIHTILGTSFYKAPVTQNVVLKMDLDVKNVFGLAIPYTATCYFEPGKVGTIDIQQRQ